MSLSRTLNRLKRGREAFASSYPAGPAARPAGGKLRELDLPFANPGNLRAFCYLPDGVDRPAGLMVVLHGCTQNAEGYDQGAGWSALAQRRGFALLYPEQKRENNPNLCFNWYQSSDATRGVGEAASIAAMIKAMHKAHGIAPAETFVTGLSAGGAMTAAMLATYPELFAGGAVIAGLPYGCANNVSEAFDCMAGRLPRDATVLANKVRAASPHKGPWPRLSVWHGGGDRIVSPANAQALLGQWTALHGLDARPDRTETVDGHKRRVWLGKDGRELIEDYHVAGMAHGTPLMPGTGEGQSGQAGAHMLDVGLSSTDRIAAFFGLGTNPATARAAPRAAPPESKPAAKAKPPSARPRPQRTASPASPPVSGIQKVIEDALRSAGLMR
jgi:poly(hydroxyalkanoate) depolymerase family esterase